jgi:hypothetical protein
MKRGFPTGPVSVEVVTVWLTALPEDLWLPADPASVEAVNDLENKGYLPDVRLPVFPRFGARHLVPFSGPRCDISGGAV